MTSTPPPFAPSRKGPAPRPPRIMIGTPSPYPMPMPMQTAQMQIPQTATTVQGSVQAGAPYWPSYANPFQYMYSQKAGEFMTKGFEGVWDFTKSGMSFGEKFVYGLYGKVSKWSKKWFTHIFLSLVVFLYTVAGAVMFKAIELNIYFQKTDEIMTKGLERSRQLLKHARKDLDNTEKFVYHLYHKMVKWSRYSFTHVLLALIIIMYTFSGAVLIKACEEPHARGEFINTFEAQQALFSAVRVLAHDTELLTGATDEWDGNLINVMRKHKDAISSFIYNDKTKEELEKFNNPWSFWNSMFYCGTIYTTIGKYLPKDARFKRQNQ